MYNKLTNRWKRTTKSVNSKPLFDEVIEFAEGLMDGAYIVWSSDTQRSSLADVISEFLDERADEGKVERHKVICDSRNNRLADMDKGIYYLTIQYQQAQCLNMTEIKYMIKDSGEYSLDLML